RPPRGGDGRSSRAGSRHPAPIPTLRWASRPDRDLDRQGRLERERPGHEAAGFGLLEEPLRALEVAAGRQDEPRPEVQLREPDGAVAAIEDALSVAVDALPAELRRGGDGAEREDEAVRRRGDEQRLRRPLISGSAVLRRRRGPQGGETAGLDEDAPVRC